MLVVVTKFPFLGSTKKKKMLRLFILVVLLLLAGGTLSTTTTLLDPHIPHLPHELIRKTLSYLDVESLLNVSTRLPSPTTLSHTLRRQYGPTMAYVYAATNHPRLLPHLSSIYDAMPNSPCGRAFAPIINGLLRHRAPCSALIDVMRRCPVDARRVRRRLPLLNLAVNYRRRDLLHALSTVDRITSLDERGDAWVVAEWIAKQDPQPPGDLLAFLHRHHQLHTLFLTGWALNERGRHLEARHLFERIPYEPMALHEAENIMSNSK
jgi:hypothetical protein